MNLHRKILETMYEDRLTVVEYQRVKDEKTKLMESKEVVVLENVPCKLSYTRVTQASQENSIATVSQVAKIFTAPEKSIKPGSKLIVTTKAGVTKSYKQSGCVASYSTHQEIVLEAFERWA